MWCGCSSNNKLCYRISEGLKIYPEHNNYEHDRYCSRYRTETGEEERKTGYVVSEEDGEVTAYLKFNPKNLDTNEKVEKEENNPDAEEMQEDGESEAVIEKEEGVVKKEEKKEPKLSLSSLVRSINVDTLTDKVMNDKKITSRENFSKQVFYRMKKIRVSRMKKTIGDLSLETDGVRFVYYPFAGALQKEEKGLTKCYLCNFGTDGKVYNNFIFPDTINKAIKEFVKMYGIEPNQDTIFAGFQYYKKTRSGVQYKVLGRVHLFQISNVGIYCRSLIEKDTFNILNIVADENKDIKFWIPADDESLGGIVEIKGKKDERITYNEELYEPLVIGEESPLCKEKFYKIINNLD